MLLLVIEADLDQRCDRLQFVVWGFVKEFHRRSVDMASVSGDVLGAGPGQISAPMARMTGAGTDVIGVEQEGIVGMKGAVSGPMFSKQKLLEKPGSVGAMPLRRARVRHRLDQLIFRRKRGGATFGLIPHCKKSFSEILRQAG